MNNVLYVTTNNTKVYKCAKVVEIFNTKEKLSLDFDELSLINHNWNKALQENQTLFNGNVLSVKSLVNEEDKIKIWLVCTNYAHMIYSMNSLEEKITVCKAIASGGLLLTNDGYFVLGKMGKLTAFPDIIQCIGGGIEEKDINGKREATVNTMIRECEEEIGVRIKEENIVCSSKYIYFREKMSTIGFCYIVNLDMSRNELCRVFESHKINNHEIDNVIFIRNSANDIIEFCQNNLLIDYAKSVLKDYCKIESLGILS